jgi:putative ABC transport system permease protein
MVWLSINAYFSRKLVPMLRNFFLTALRMLRVRRLYTALNVVGLAIGMAGGLLIFLFLRHHLTTDHHHSRFERTYRVVTDLHLEDGSVEHYPEAPLPMGEALRHDFSSVEQTAFVIHQRDVTVGVTREDHSSPAHFLEHEGLSLVETDYFHIFDYHWLAGDPNQALQDPNCVVLTQSWARKYFGEENPLGKVLILNGRMDAKVTGVLADPSLPTDLKTGCFLSMASLPHLQPGYDRTDWALLNSTNRLYLTLKPGSLASTLEKAFPGLSLRHFGADAHVFQFRLQALGSVHFDVQRSGGVIRRSMLWTLGAVGGLLVLMACINFVNLSTAQAIRRSREVGVRKTLGSSRGQLIGQFMVETGLVVLLATLLMLLLAALGLPMISHWTRTPLTFRFDGSTVGFLGLLTAGVTAMAGTYPALVLSGFSPGVALRGKAYAPTGNGNWLRQGLVVTQFVAGQGLLLAALVISAQMRYVQHTDLGFHRENVVVVHLPNREASARKAFENELRGYADIKTVSASFQLPSNPGMYGVPSGWMDKPNGSVFPFGNGSPIRATWMPTE